MARNRNREQRGGLSRGQLAAMQGPRRAHGDDLIKSLFGDTSTYFAQNPLDGPDIIKAMPKPQETSGLGGPAVQPMTANDPVAGQADWFKGTGREGTSSSAPKAVATKPKPAPSLAEAISAAEAGLAANRAMGSTDGVILTGLPGDTYEDILDQMDRPPNTY